jgi:hypothetical protein
MRSSALTRSPLWRKHLVITLEKSQQQLLLPGGGGEPDGVKIRVFMSVAHGFSIKPPLFTEGRAPLGGRAILARPQKWPFLLILRVKASKMRDLRLRPEEVAFKPSAAPRSEASDARHIRR